VYTRADIEAMVLDHLGSAQGQSVLASHGITAYSLPRRAEIARLLANDLVRAFLSLCTGRGVFFDSGSISIKYGDDESMKIVIPAQALRRESLYYTNKDGNMQYTGGGIRDIFALFTKGWHAKKGYVYGYDSNKRWVRSRKYYPGNAFITHIISAYEQSYPFLQITYPKAWGGK